MNVLVIGDTHIPFEKKGYLEFCKQVEKDYKCKAVVHIGDLVDNHSISYHEHDPDGWSPLEEMKATDKVLVKWFQAFPKLYLCRGNHDCLVDRKGKTVGLPKRCFKDYRDIWKLPRGWHDGFVWEINNVLFTHGTNRRGVLAHKHLAQENGMSTVMGHTHSVAGVEMYVSEKLNIFGMNVGCGIDRHKYAFAYGKDFPRKPIVSCGVVFNDKQAQIITMRLGR